MKFNLFAAAIASRAALAHYTFDRLILPDGTVTGQWEYIREHWTVSKVFAAQYIIPPGWEVYQITPYDRDFACNINATASAYRTGVASIPAGSKVGVKVLGQLGDGVMFHPGPFQVYMSKAPTGSVVDYDGSGEWFKIHQDTTCGEGSLSIGGWCSWQKGQLDFEIPENLPPGEYLLRAEHIALHHGDVDDPEFYFSCAQVKITGDGNGTPSPTVPITEAYVEREPALSFNVYQEKTYPFSPGPEIWTG